MSGAGPPPRASIDTNPEQNRPDPTPHQSGPPTDAQQRASVIAAGPAGGKKKRARRGRKKSERKRKQSFAATDDDDYGVRNTAHESFSRLKERNGSHDTLDTNPLDTDLLDHRGQSALRPRRASTLQPNAFGQSTYDGSGSGRPSYSNPFSPREGGPRRGNSHHASLENLDEDADERTPMLSGSKPKAPGFLNQGSRSNTNIYRKNSGSSGGSRHKPTIFDRDPVAYNTPQPSSYNVNYPPSVPGSPRLSSSQGRAISFHDVLAREEYSPERHSEDGLGSPRNGETLHDHSLHGSSHRSAGFERRPTIAARAEEDVCFPAETLSEMGDGGDEAEERSQGQGDENVFGKRQPRRRRGRWPDLRVLEEWSMVEKEGRSEEQRRAKRMVEPQLIGGRLRPTHQRNWHRVEEDAPYRFTYFNEDFPSTIHSQSISELVQPEGSFRELFIPDPPQLSDSSSEEEDDDVPEASYLRHSNNGTNGDSRAPTRQTTREGSVLEEQKHYSTPAVPAIDRDNSNGNAPSRTSTPHGEKQSTSSNMDGAAHSVNIPIPDHGNGINRENSSGQQSPKTRDRPARYGDRPTWWLDVLSPTDSEMKVLSKAFGIHPLTAEDIMMQEAREKVELFRNYYFVNYRTFEQDMSNEDFLEPVNMYIIVFREGVISFHFSLTPHPANVRRRIRQLKDYLILSSDWISYAMIDDITDVFAPLIQNIEDEVDDIDDSILMLHSPSRDQDGPFDEKKSDNGKDAIESGGDMLRRVGDCRKKVMGLYRLLGNKADVIKGFAKRCNEHWEVAPRSEIGLYLGDIQDHIVTMTGNLSHYEKILARSHGNYLAQINIRMNERQEQTADVLGKLTVLGTIVLPMNIITGLWGMNVWVPGQDSEDNLTWFWCITGGLLAFGLACYFIAKTLYKIV